MQQKPLLLLLLLVLGAATPLLAAASAAASAADDSVILAQVSHKLTGVAATQQQHRHLDGRGVAIAFTDTGINYRHPSFGACAQLGLGSKCRVQGGWDLVGDAEPGDLVGGLTSFKPDSDPMECSMNATHGTQVASVAAGDASYVKDRPWRGVAYAANILAYKVTTGCKYKAGTVSTTATLGAIKKAMQSKADVINLSWGDFRGGGYPNPNFTAALSSAMRQGALVSMAAGNDGIMGPYFTEAGIAVPDVLSVASVDIWVNFTEVSLQLDVPVTVDKTRTQTLAAFGPTLPPSTNMLAADNLATRLAALPLPANIVPVSPATACGPLTTPKSHLKGQIALVKRGECTFQEKAAAAAAAGAAEVLVYSDVAAAAPQERRFAQMNLQDVPEIPIWGLQLAESQAILAAVEAAAAAAAGAGGSKQRASGFVRVLSAQTAAPGPYEVAVTPSYFSSWGPSVTLDMLPSIAAPGSSVLAATAHDAYTEVEGTSFAAPYVSGALALWRQAHKGRDPAALVAHKLLAGGAAAAAAPPVAAAAKASVAAPGAGGSVSGPAQPLRAELSKKPAAAAAVGASQTLRKPLQAAAVKAPAAGISSGKKAPTLQQAAFAAFVSTAQPLDWRGTAGWAQPVARMGAGLLQVDAAISNPTVISPTHLLLRSNQASQTLSVTVTNTAAFPVSYRLGHKPAAAILTKDLWVQGDQDALLTQVAAAPVFKLAGKPADVLTLGPRQSATLQVTFKASPQLQAQPYVFSGYLTLTPAAAAAVTTRPAQQQEAQRLPAASSGIKQRAVPLVLPYQGFSQNYTMQPILPPRNVSLYPEEIQDLTGLLHVCYASHDARGAFDPTATLADASSSAASDSSSSEPDAQDGTLGRRQVTECQHTYARDKDVTQLFLGPISKGKGVVMASVALLRPALRLSLVLFEADDCRSSSSSSAKVAQESGSGRRLLLGAPQQQQQQRLPGCKPGLSVGPFKQYVGEVWRYETPSRDIPGSLWAYYNAAFRGNVTVRDPRTDAVVGSTPVQPGKMYRMQLWVVAPLAAADRAAGEQYKTWKFDIKGGFTFV